MMKTMTNPPIFDPGRILMTPGAQSAMIRSGQVPSEFIARHVKRDWGKLDDHDRRANDSAMKTGLRLLSSYETKEGDTLWVITEAVDLERPGASPHKRETTTILTPDEY